MKYLLKISTKHSKPTGCFHRGEVGRMQTRSSYTWSTIVQDRSIYVPVISLAIGRTIGIGFLSFEIILTRYVNGQIRIAFLLSRLRRFLSSTRNLFILIATWTIRRFIFIYKGCWQRRHFHLFTWTTKIKYMYCNRVF